MGNGTKCPQTEHLDLSLTVNPLIEELDFYTAFEQMTFTPAYA